jgi:hypothetical protein
LLGSAQQPTYVYGVAVAVTALVSLAARPNSKKLESIIRVEVEAKEC